MSVQTPTRPITGPAPAIQDPYPTRLAKKPDMPWLNRREKVVKGQAADGPLSQQQLDEFEQRGFLFEPDFLDQREVQELTGHLHELLARDEFRGRDFSVTEPGSEEIRSLFAVHFLSERFRQLARDPRLTGRARQILGGDVYVHQSRINYKPGFHGKGFNWHSDFETWHAEDGMPSMHAVSASIVLTDNHHFNGPLMLIPGSHKVFVPCLGATPDDHHKQSLKTQEFGVPGNDVLQIDDAEIFRNGYAFTANPLPYGAGRPMNGYVGPANVIGSLGLLAGSILYTWWAAADGGKVASLRWRSGERRRGQQQEWLHHGV